MHMAMAAWHALTLVSFIARGSGTDTRPPDIRDPSCCELACYEDEGCMCSGCPGQRDGDNAEPAQSTFARWASDNCLHPKTYVSVAGTTNCEQCLKVLLDEHGCPYNGVVGKPHEHDPELVHKR